MPGALAALALVGVNYAGLDRLLSSGTCRTEEDSADRPAPRPDFDLALLGLT